MSPEKKRSVMEKFLRGKRVYLRGLKKKDCAGSYRSFINDAESLIFVGDVGRKPLSKEDLEAYIKTCAARSDLLLGIFENKTGAHVGNIHLSQIHPYHRGCLYGIILDRKYMGKGYAREASELVIKHAFEQMNINRIQINCVEKNKDALSLYKRLGAVEEGRLRQAFYRQNRYLDLMVFSILKDEYFRRKSRQRGR